MYIRKLKVSLCIFVTLPAIIFCWGDSLIELKRETAEKLASKMLAERNGISEGALHPGFRTVG